MKKLLPFIFTLLAFTACNKPDPNPPEDEPEECIDENGLPCLKTEGSNMFACLVDGEPFIAGVQNYTIGERFLFLEIIMKVITVYCFKQQWKIKMIGFK